MAPDDGLPVPGAADSAAHADGSLQRPAADDTAAGRVTTVFTLSQEDIEEIRRAERRRVEGTLTAAGFPAESVQRLAGAHGKTRAEAGEQAGPRGRAGRDDQTADSGSSSLDAGFRQPVEDSSSRKPNNYRRSSVPGALVRRGSMALVRRGSMRAVPEPFETPHADVFPGGSSRRGSGTRPRLSIDHTARTEDDVEKAFEGISPEILYGSRHTNRGRRASSPTVSGIPSRTPSFETEASDEGSPQRKAAGLWAITRKESRKKIVLPTHIFLAGIASRTQSSKPVDNSSVEMAATKDNILQRLDILTTAREPDPASPEDSSGHGHVQRKSLKMAVRKVIHTRRMMKDVENRRVWSKARGRDNTPWYAQTLKLNSRGYLAASNAVMLCSLVDICVMMLDAVGYHSCSQLCHDNGGPFSSSSIHFRGHIGESFRTIKTALGILCDLMYLLYLGISFRTVLLCVSPCVSTVTLVLDFILFSSCFPASCALLRVHYARALFDQRLVWPQVRRRSSLANHGDISHKQIATGYLKSMFMTDLLTCAPLYWIFFDVPWVRVNRIFNVLRLNFDVEVVIKFLHAMKIKARVQLIHLSVFLGVLFVYVHIMTCITVIICWAVLSDSEEESVSAEVLRWLDVSDTDKADTTDITFFYFHCSLWVWSNVSGWGGNWSPHSPISSAWTYCQQFLGVFLYMYLFGGIVNILQNFDLAAAEFTANRDKMTTFLQARDIPHELQMRVGEYFDNVWELKHGVEEHELLDQLPTYLRHDIAWFLNQQFLEKLPMFYGADASALLEINRYLVMTVANSGEYVARDGELNREIHFVLTGEVHILSENGDTDIELFDGSIVGEISLVFDIPSPFDAQVKRTASLFTMADSHFYDVTTKYPVLLRRIHRRGQAVFGDRWEKWEQQANKIHASDVESDDGGEANSDFTFHGTLGRKTSTTAVKFAAAAINRENSKPNLLAGIQRTRSDASRSSDGRTSSVAISSGGDDANSLRRSGGSEDCASGADTPAVPSPADPLLNKAKDEAKIELAKVAMRRGSVEAQNLIAREREQWRHGEPNSNGNRNLEQFESPSHVVAHASTPHSLDTTGIARGGNAHQRADPTLDLTLSILLKDMGEIKASQTQMRQELLQVQNNIAALLKLSVGRGVAEAATPRSARNLRSLMSLAPLPQPSPRFLGAGDAAAVGAVDDVTPTRFGGDVLAATSEEEWLGVAGGAGQEKDCH